MVDANLALVIVGGITLVSALIISRRQPLDRESPGTTILGKT